jgi:Domain of unknown function (DUF4062)
MAFEIDVLITYAEKDNEVGKQNEQGWITQFKKFLEFMLLQSLGYKPNVVIKSEFDTATAPTLENVAVLVTVLSKEFAQSGRCLDLVELFYKVTASTKLNRVYKVLKAPMALPEQPPRLRDSLGYEMYQLDDETGLMKEYADFFSPEAEKQYWMKMVDLGYDIHQALDALKGEENSVQIKNIFKRKTIYLAETGHDLSVQRNIIKRELLRNGYSILPNRTLSSQSTEVERAIKNDLEECQMSIHLIGNAYGEIPDGTDRSIVDIQNKLAAEYAATKKKNKEEFSRFIWIAQDLKTASDKQKTFIEKLKRDTEAQEGAELLQNPLEDFKNILREELLNSQEITTITNSGGKSIYLVYDRVDQAEVKPFQEAVQKSGFKVLVPSFEGDLLAVRRQHITNLQNFDGAIVFKGKVNDQWVRMKLLDLMKAPGFGRKKPIQGKALISKGNMDEFKNQQLTIISEDGGKSIETLTNFLKEIETN